MNRAFETVAPDQLIGRLKEIFIPAVQHKLEPILFQIRHHRGPEVRVEYDVVATDELMMAPQVMYLLTIAVHSKVYMDELQKIAATLDQFGSYERGPLPRFNGLEFCLGDGDDSGAVFYSDGVFCIWLRGLTPMDELEDEVNAIAKAVTRALEYLPVRESEARRILQDWLPKIS